MRLSELTTLPNLITLYRVVVAAPIVLLLVSGSPHALWVAFVLMVVAEVSDAVDGYAARRLQQVSDIGKILDPLADSFYRVSVFAAFAANEWMPIWMLLVMVWRDIGVAYLRVIAEQTRETLGARQSGKLKAVAQGGAQLLVALVYAVSGAATPSSGVSWLWFVLLAATAITAISLIDYAMDVLSRRRRA
ncbi:MAG: CDP-diacylglycerol--glycerol-3-phosphate 3-phosphatidyltransferase [Hyphomicrobiaceae bacterium]|nr:CDP-diacylglycerol--glycerol-3-phosphate 3-phosphatidyltransferase [Hyphomicrobiaceae bacterium]